MAGWQKLIKSGSDARLNSLNVTTWVSASLGFFGTASWAVSASWAPGGSSVSASYSTTSSYASNADLTQIYTPQIVNNTNNYDPPGFYNSKVVFVSFDSASKGITGLASGSAGMVKWFINSGSNLGYIASEHPSSSAANRIAGSVDHLLTPGGVVHVLYDSVNSRWRVTYNSYDISDIPLNGIGSYYNQMPGSTNQADHPVLGLATTGTGATNANQPPSGTLPSVWELDPGTTATGVSTLYLTKNNLAIDYLGTAHFGGWTLIYITVLSTGAQRIRAHMNILPNASSTAAHVANSFGWRYCDDSSSGAWEFFTRNNSNVETTGSSGITVATNTLYLLKAFAPIDLSEVRFYLTDGVNTYNNIITSNLPDSGRSVGMRVSVHKAVGSTSRIIRVGNIGQYAIRK